MRWSWLLLALRGVRADCDPPCGGDDSCLFDACVPVCDRPLPTKTELYHETMKRLDVLTDPTYPARDSFDVAKAAALQAEYASERKAGTWVPRLRSAALAASLFVPLTAEDASNVVLLNRDYYDEDEEPTVPCLDLRNFDDAPCTEGCEGTATKRCCACGGGRPNPDDESTLCVDGLTTDATRDGCAWYVAPFGNLQCGRYDDDDFDASYQCCACGGGFLVNATRGEAAYPVTNASRPTGAPTPVALYVEDDAYPSCTESGCACPGRTTCDAGYCLAPLPPSASTCAVDADCVGLCRDGACVANCRHRLWPFVATPTGRCDQDCACDAPLRCTVDGRCAYGNGTDFFDGTSPTTPRPVDGCVDGDCTWDDPIEDDDVFVEPLTCDGSPWCEYKVGRVGGGGFDCRPAPRGRAQVVCCRDVVVGERATSQCDAQDDDGVCYNEYAPEASWSWASNACAAREDGWRLCRYDELRNCDPECTQMNACETTAAWTDHTCNYVDACAANNTVCGATYHLRTAFEHHESAVCERTAEGGCGPKPNVPRFYGSGGGGTYNVYVRHPPLPLPDDAPSTLVDGYDHREPTNVRFTRAQRRSFGSDLVLCPPREACVGACPPCTSRRTPNREWRWRAPDGVDPILTLLALDDGYRYENVTFLSLIDAFAWANCTRTGATPPPGLDSCVEEAQHPAPLLSNMARHCGDATVDARRRLHPWGVAPHSVGARFFQPRSVVFVVDSGTNAHDEFHADDALPDNLFDDRTFEAVGTVDEHGHGTHVAALVGGEQYGFHKASVVVPVRVTSANHAILTSTLSTALAWIGDRVAEGYGGPFVRYVVNLSLCFTNAGADAGVRLKLAALTTRGVLVAVAACNEGDDNAAHGMPNYKSAAADVLVVAAHDDEGRLASFSCFGDHVDVMAPGVDVLSASKAGGSAAVTMSGTSQASPSVAGLLSALRANYPEHQAFDTKAHFLARCTKPSSGDANPGHWWGTPRVPSRVVDPSVDGCLDTVLAMGCCGGDNAAFETALSQRGWTNVALLDADAEKRLRVELDAHLEEDVALFTLARGTPPSPDANAFVVHRLGTCDVDTLCGRTTSPAASATPDFAGLGCRELERAVVDACVDGEGVGAGVDVPSGCALAFCGVDDRPWHNVPQAGVLSGGGGRVLPGGGGDGSVRLAIEVELEGGLGTVWLVVLVAASVLGLGAVAWRYGRARPRPRRTPSWRRRAHPWREHH